MKKSSVIKLLCCLASFALSTQALACSRVFHTETQAFMVGRNMDWPAEMQQQIRVYPRGMQRTGLSLQGNSLHWTSKYGSMVVTAFLILSAEGINERGLAVHLLSLEESDYGTRHANLPGMSVGMWAQYYLDQFATVKEAVMAARQPGYELEAGLFPLNGKFRKVNLHLAIEDAEGYSAVIEYIDGTPHIHVTHGNATLTNSPVYEKQLANLKNYAGLGGDKPLPGTTLPIDRFVRATYYNQHLPTSKSLDEEVYSVLAIMRNVAQPFGVASAERTIMSETLWNVVGDITHRVYYYTSTTSPNMVKVDLNKFNLSAGSPAMMLDIVARPELSGDVSDKFVPLG
jgi:penicillin V acylase-like amidase (Ntn superfamily)